MSKWRKRPIVVEAFRWTGGPDQTEDPEWIVEAIRDGRVRIVQRGCIEVACEHFASYCTLADQERGCDRPMTQLAFTTLEGDVRACPGDWIVKGVRGELYPCCADIFSLTYERVDDAS